MVAATQRFHRTRGSAQPATVQNHHVVRPPRPRIALSDSAAAETGCCAACHACGSGGARPRGGDAIMTLRGWYRGGAPLADLIRAARPAKRRFEALLQLRLICI